MSHVSESYSKIATIALKTFDSDWGGSAPGSFGSQIYEGI